MSYSEKTELLHHSIDTGSAHPLVTPLYQNSAFLSESTFFYTRKSNPNSQEFEERVALLEGAKHGISVTTGMSAIALTATLLKPGQTVVVNSCIYGCSLKLWYRLAKRLDLNLLILDLCNEEEIAQIPSDCGMVFLETPTNPFLKVIDLGSLSQKVKHNCANARIVVDNTWATPLYQHPLEHGADISLHSATKFLSGHSDVMGGCVLVNDDALAEHLYEERFYLGAILDPHSAWLLNRSLQTFHLRMGQHEVVTEKMVQFLEQHPLIEKVFTPPIDGKQLMGYAGILFVTLAPALQGKYETFKKQLNLYNTGTGMACTTSMVAQPSTGSHASLQKEEQEKMGITEDLVRLCFGFEDVQELMDDVAQALEKTARM